MSKLVYLNIPAHGHVNPTLPVVQELVQRGEQVLYYNTEEFRPQIERSGATFRAYPETELTATAIEATLQEGNIVNIPVLLLRTTETLLPFLLDALPAEQPDLLLFDSTALWGRIASTRLALRAVSSITTFVLDEASAGMSPREVWGIMRQALPNMPTLLWTHYQLVRRYGKEAVPPLLNLFPLRGGLNLVFTSRALQPDTPLIDESFCFVGPSINLQTRGGDFPLDSLGESQLVYISMGTIHHASLDFCRQCFEAFGDYPAQFILSAGKTTEIKKLGAIPANFIVKPSVPQLEVLQRASAFITHGGINSVHEGLYYGVPLLLIPHQVEQLLNARCVEAAGAGLLLNARLARGRVQAAELRAALERLLSEPRYREAAGKVQQTLRATGGYRQAADEIQAYLARSQTS